MIGVIQNLEFVDFIGDPGADEVAAGTRLTVSVAASADDAAELVSNGTVDLSLGEYTVNAGIFFAPRFLVPTLPQGANIVSAKIQFAAAQNQAGSGTLRFWGEAADAAAQYTTTVDDISDRTLTTETVDWLTVSWVDEASGADQLSQELKSLVQPIVDRAGFDGVLAFVIQGVTEVGAAFPVIATFDHATLAAPELTLTYTTA